MVSAFFTENKRQDFAAISHLILNKKIRGIACYAVPLI